jgi:hypothetical protein
MSIEYISLTHQTNTFVILCPHIRLGSVAKIAKDPKESFDLNVYCVTCGSHFMLMMELQRDFT